MEIFFAGCRSDTDHSSAPSTVVAARLEADRSAEIPHQSCWEVFATEANHVLTSAVVDRKG